ncbi:HupE/UreJ family protein [Hyunsoonleella sp. SJ7]|uniref:HupE/UreJ family protein n=1 Tax=Hyunsoonleella aquatilis TaxID=2762758 RepID=A0A923HAZ1_9FLAO|nr:HupE/UreJ family protein [Hyunsoonleella aquatilis]MBC3759109.1 HupE/UreJ family protein [Hyunsoonleella aquatilis]
MKTLLTKTLVALFLLLSATAFAHLPNQSYLYLRIYEDKGIEGRYEINVRELNDIFNLNLPKNATPEDVEPYAAQIQAYILQNAGFSSDFGKHDINFTEIGDIWISTGNFMQFYFNLSNMKTLPEDLTIYYNIAFEEDDEHKGFVVVEYNWKAGVINEEANIVMDFGPDDTEGVLDLSDSHTMTGFIAMIKQGIWHIWIGIDHILFLLALILPAVVRRKDNTIFGWEPVMTFKSAFIYIIKVVSFFTIAHTITLTLASLQLVNLPSRLVESIIAFSIALAAYHNIKPIFKMKDWVIAFIFGLFHGFGFATVLGDLGLSNEFLTLSLLGFNIGVEIGQLIIIAIIFPILYFIRKLKLYPKFIFYTSIILIVVSLLWCYERVFDDNLMFDDYIRIYGFKFAQWLGLK